MTRAGTCKIIVEPHIFDATIFVVRDQSAPLPQPVGGERQFLQYGPTSGPTTHSSQFVQPRPPNPSPLQRPPYAGPQMLPKAQSSATPSPITPTQAGAFPGKSTNLPQASAPRPTPPSLTPSSSATGTTPVTQGGTQPANPKPTPAASPAVQAKPASTPAVNSPASGSNGTPVAQPAKPPASTQSTPRPPAPSTNDPVIQLLAQRASRDNHLKSVMKIVATGKATPEELAYFQSHIDELTRFVKAEEARKAAAAARAPVNTTVLQPSQPHLARPPAYNTPNRVPIPPSNSAQRTIYPNSPIPTPPPKPKIQMVASPPLHVLIEFSMNNHDRFLFPKFSILEQSPDAKNMLVSFLVVKKPSQLAEADAAAETKKTKKSKADKAAEAAAGDVKKEDVQNGVVAGLQEKDPNEDKELYQPITMRLEAPSDGNLFSLISRVVAPLEEVQKHMKDVAAKCEMAPKRHLALRLPKESRERNN
jgi:hypothetical protein